MRTRFITAAALVLLASACKEKEQQVVYLALPVEILQAKVDAGIRSLDPFLHHDVGHHRQDAADQFDTLRQAFDAVGLLELVAVIRIPLAGLDDHRVAQFLECGQVFQRADVHQRRNGTVELFGEMLEALLVQQRVHDLHRRQAEAVEGGQSIAMMRDRLDALFLGHEQHRTHAAETCLGHAHQLVDQGLALQRAHGYRFCRARAHFRALRIGIQQPHPHPFPRQTARHAEAVDTGANHHRGSFSSHQRFPTCCRACSIAAG